MKSMLFSLVFISFIFFISSCSNDVKRISSVSDSDIIANTDSDNAKNDSDNNLNNDNTTSDGTVNDNTANDGVVNDNSTTDDVINDNPANDNSTNDNITTSDDDTVTTTQCELNGGQCLPFSPNGSCPEGYTAGSFDCNGDGVMCCVKGAVTGHTIEVTAPQPVPANLSAIVWVAPTANGGSSTPPITADISGPVTAIGLVQNGNKNGCTAYNFATAGGQGFIALVERGTCNFSQKVDNAAKAGATAIIIFNNQAGAVQDWATGGTIPMAGISQADGANMYSFAGEHADITATIHP